MDNELCPADRGGCGGHFAERFVIIIIINNFAKYSNSRIKTLSRCTNHCADLATIS